MKLNTKERLTIKDLLPGTGSAQQMRMRKSILTKVAFNQADIDKLGLKADARTGRYFWNTSADFEKEIEFSGEEITMLQEMADIADDRHRISEDMLDIWDKIIATKGPINS